MSDLDESLARMRKKLEGDGPIEKQMMLVKLEDLYKNRPADEDSLKAGTPAREWVSEVGAIVSRYKGISRARFDAKIMTLGSIYSAGISDFIGIAGDAIEAMRLDLELEGRSDVGTVYAPGEVYRFFADVKEIIGGTQNQLLAVDAYLTGKAFDNFFGAVRDMTLRILTNAHCDDIKNYAERHTQQYGTKIEVRASKEIHDRLFIRDGGDSWAIGGSLNQTGKQATYLLPLTPGIAQTARDLYDEIWNRATPK